MFVTCPICNNEFSNLSVFEKHLNEGHNITTQELWDKINNGPVYCSCGCGEETAWVNWHIGYRTMKNLHCNRKCAYDIEKQSEIFEKRSRSLKGKESWNKGLTKDSDLRVNSTSRKISDTMRERYNRGELSQWNKGLTSEIDDRVKGISEKNRKKFDIVKEIKINESLIERLDYNINSSIEYNELLDISNIKPGILFQCRNCNWRGKVNFEFALKDMCPICSRVENKKIFEYLSGFDFKIVKNIKGLIGKSTLDLYIPNLNFAIDVMSLKNNNLSGFNRFYMQNKINSCAKFGIFYMIFFEDEIEDKFDIVKSVINRKLNTSKNEIKLNSKWIELDDHKIMKEFFVKNHLEGYIKKVNTKCLKQNDQIYMMINYKEENDIFKILRMAINKDYQIVNLTDVIRNVSNKKIQITFDERHELDLINKIKEFELISSDENYYWTNENKRFGKYYFNSEVDAYKFGYSKIWSCKKKNLQLII